MTVTIGTESAFNDLVAILLYLELASQHADAEPRSRAFFRKALEDERRDRAWMADYR